MYLSPVMWMTAAAALVLPGTLPAQPVTATISSHSGQFIVHGQAVIGTALNFVAPNSPEVFLDPALLAISCERIKTQLLELLEQPDQWQARIMANIDPTLGDSRAILLKAKPFADGWQYRLTLPSQVDRRHLVKTVVELLLLEMANRNAKSRLAELPPWLPEGVTSIISADNLSNLTLDQQITQSHRIPAKDPLNEVKKVLTTRPPLTLDELNWPRDENVGGDQLRVYEMCAHLMVVELLRLEEGPRNMHRFLQLLAEYQNWQLAFFQAFQNQFPGMIQWDKWWSLLLVNIANRDLFLAWSPEESWSKFEEILTTPVQVHVRQQELPMAAQASLQSIIQEWEHRRQINLLNLKLNHLNALRVRAAQEVVGLVDDYRNVISNYLRERSRPGVARRILPGIANELARNTVAQLNELDQRKATVRRLLNVAKSGNLTQNP